MIKECPKCKTELDFQVVKLNIQDEKEQWYIISTEHCPICKSLIGLEKFATSEEAHLELGENMELDLTGTEK